MFTQPEPINHNELKRLLCEIFDDLLDEVDLVPAVGATDVERRDSIKRRLFRKIDCAVLNGDDS